MAVRSVIGNVTVSLRGLIVSAGKARYEGALAGCVVPWGELADVLRGTAAVSPFGQSAIERAWGLLKAEAARMSPTHAHADRSAPADHDGGLAGTSLMP